MLVPGQSLLNCQVKPGIKAIVSAELLRGPHLWKLLNLLLEALLLLRMLLLIRLLNILRLYGLLRSALLQLLDR